MYALMADLHMHQWSAFASMNPDGVNNRLRGLLDEIGRACKELLQANDTDTNPTVIMAGDVFHVRGSVNPVVLNSLIDCLAACHKQYGTRFVIIPGNHDLAGRDSERLGSAVTALECDYVTVTADTLTLAEHRVAMIPWHESIESLKAEILRVRDELVGSTTEGSVADWDLVLHAPIDGVIDGLPSHGLDPAWLSETGFRRVYSGHYHNHKVFPAGLAVTEVVSIGALAHHTWSDVGTKAGFLLVDEDKMTWRKSHLPQFVDLSQLVAFDPNDVPLLVDGNYVRVRVEADKSKEVETARKELMDMGAMAVLVQAMPKAAAVRAGATVATVNAGASLEASVSEFIKGMTGLADSIRVATAAMDVLASVETSGD
ncbi:hypothetical protein D9M72_137470 [compost metagenome]